MKQSKVTLHPSYTVGEISPRLFGSFIEPIGNMVNGSMYQPDHPTADEQGFRQDFIHGLKDAGLPCVRYGGNFVSGWRWKDCVGPMDKRKTILDRSRSAIIPKEIGPDEYLQWAEKIGTEMMYTINLGTDGINEAVDFIDYANFPSGTEWSDARISNGHKDPYNVKIWFLGNEMDGPWQMGSYEMDPKGYGVLAHEVSKLMKMTDPTIQTVACVSCSPFLSHYPDWDRQVLEKCYGSVDYISLHHYHSAVPGDVAALMAGTEAFEDYINTEIALCDYLKTKFRSKKTMYLSLDEYGNMFRPSTGASYGLAGQLPGEMFYEYPDRPYTYQDPNDWSHRFGPRKGEMALAIADACVGLTMMKHADRVKIGCATGGLGMLCATDKDHTWKSAAYFTMTDFIKYAKGEALMPVVECDSYNVGTYAIDDMNQYPGFENVPYIRAGAALNDKTGELTIFVANADDKDEHEFTLDVRGFEGYEFVEHTTMYTDDFEASNSYEHPDTIHPVTDTQTKCEDGIVTAVLKKLSWNVFKFKKSL